MGKACVVRREICTSGYSPDITITISNVFLSGRVNLYLAGKIIVQVHKIFHFISCLGRSGKESEVSCCE